MKLIQLHFDTNEAEFYLNADMVVYFYTTVSRREGGNGRATKIILLSTSATAAADPTNEGKRPEKSIFVRESMEQVALMIQNVSAVHGERPLFPSGEES